MAGKEECTKCGSRLVGLSRALCEEEETRFLLNECRGSVRVQTAPGGHGGGVCIQTPGVDVGLVPCQEPPIRLVKGIKDESACKTERFKKESAERASAW